jgi:hypothetical protein
MLKQRLEKALLGVMSSGLVVGVITAQLPAHALPTNVTPSTPGATAASQPSRAQGVTPPLESQFVPKARIQLNADRTNITLINNTNAVITYQAVGDTQPRILQGGQRIDLRGLRAPVTLTLDRQDAGLLLVTPRASATSPNTLEVSLDTTTNLSADTTTLRVEQTGSVYTY